MEEFEKQRLADLAEEEEAALNIASQDQDQPQQDSEIVDYKGLIEKMKNNWSDDDMDEKACKEMAKEWFELVDFDESNEINASKFVSLVTESLAMEEDQEKIKKCF